MRPVAAAAPRSSSTAFGSTPLIKSGRLIEVQSAALGPLRGKLRRLLPEHRIRIIKPVVLKRRVMRKSRPDGPVLSARQSPKRGKLFDVFDDLIGLVRVFPHPTSRSRSSASRSRKCASRAAAGQALRSSIVA